MLNPEDLIRLSEHMATVEERLSALEARVAALDGQHEPRPILVGSQMHNDPTVRRARFEGTPHPGDPSVRPSAPAPTSSAYASGAPIVVRPVPPPDASADALELEGLGDLSAR